MTCWCEKSRRAGTDRRHWIGLAILLTWTIGLSAMASAEEPQACPLRPAFQPFRTVPGIARFQPRRILIVTALNRQDRLREQDVLGEQLAKALRAGSNYDVVVCKDCACDASSPIRTGQFDERKLIGFAKRYLADSVLYCQVESIDAYRPMNVELEFVLINTAQSIAVVSGSLNMDLANPVTEQMYLNSYGVELEHGITLLTSPTRLIGFSAWQLADALKAIW